MTKRIKKDFKDSPANISNLFKEASEVIKEQDTSVYDFKISKLKAQTLISAIMMTLLVSRECSQREIAQTLKSASFADILNGGKAVKTEHSAISHRLSTLSSEYAKSIYTAIYQKVKRYYVPQELGGFNVVAEDSTLVTETSARLSEGLRAGRNNNALTDKSQRQVKYTVGYDGIGAAFIDLFTEQSYLSENKALFSSLKWNVKPADGHRNLYVFDRGLNSTLKLNSLMDDGIFFVGRLNLNRVYEVVKELPVTQMHNGCTVESDVMAKLAIRGNVPKDAPVLRIIKVNVGRSVMTRKGHRDRMDDYILLITDAFSLSEEDIIEAYRLRWEIEVFFKLLKQNLSFAHFVSVNRLGLETVMYCVLSMSLLLLLYSRVKKESVKGAIFDLKLQLLGIIWETEQLLKESESESAPHCTPIPKIDQ
mgnify:FL=1